MALSRLAMYRSRSSSTARPLLFTTSTNISVAPTHISQLALVTQFVNEPSKGNPNMRHLDIYARRDPQLAPYLLREVDIEYKRKCRKVNFVFWTSICVALILFHTRESLEVAFYLRNYTELLRDELDAKDDDMDLRRAKMVQLLQLVKKVEKRAADDASRSSGGGGGGGTSSSSWFGGASSSSTTKNHWTDADTAEAEKILRTSSVPEGQRKVAKGSKNIDDIDLTGNKGKEEIYSIKGSGGGSEQSNPAS